MMKLPLLPNTSLSFLSLFCLPSVIAAEIFVNPSTGDDSASGEQGAPLKSVALGVYLDNGTTNALVSENVSPLILGDINGPTSGRSKFKNQFEKAKKDFPEEEIFVSKFFDNHATSEHRHNQKGELAAEKVQTIIDNAGVGEDFAAMEKFLPQDRAWEHLKEGSRYFSAKTEN